MSSTRGKSYKHMLVTATGTSGSRILGLFRDQLIAGFFGTGSIAAAFIIAFQIPNLFRRLLGEGALTAALMPTLTQERSRLGDKGAFRFLNCVLTRTVPWMLVLTGTFILGALGIVFLPETYLLPLMKLFDAGTDLERYRLAAGLTALCMPYMPMICVAAIFTAALNMLGRFTVTSLSAIWMNLSMIFSLGVLGWYFGETPEERVTWLCVGALFGGALQLGVPAIVLWRNGWRLFLNRERSEAWEDLKLMFVPALIGAGVNQINVFLTRFLAFSLDEQALSVYYYANRVVEIPVGIFTVTVTTVVFPLLAKYAAEKQREQFGEAFSHGLRMIFAINIPATIGIIILSQPLIRVFFEHGNFSKDDTALTVPVLCVFALAIPFYAVSGIAGRALNALKDSKTQMRTGILALCTNLVLAPVLGYFFQATGLAVSNLFAAIIQCLFLVLKLYRHKDFVHTGTLGKSFFKVTLASLIMGGVTAGLWFVIENFLRKEFLFMCGGNEFVFSLMAFFIVVPISVLFYFGLMKLLRFPECDEFVGLFLKKLKKKNRG